MPKIFATPAEGVSVPSPDHGGEPLPAKGAEVKASIYWTRRERASEVTLSDIAPAKSAPKTAKEG